MTRRLASPTSDYGPVSKLSPERRERLADKLDELERLADKLGPATMPQAMPRQCLSNACGMPVALLEQCLSNACGMPVALLEQCLSNACGMPVARAELFDLESIGRAYNVSERTLRRHIKAGKLKVYRVGRRYRCTRADIDAWLAAMEVQ